MLSQSWKVHDIISNIYSDLVWKYCGLKLIAGCQENEVNHDVWDIVLTYNLLY